MQGKLVVELGSGCGLVGLVLACLGARVLLTDLAHVLVCSAAQQPSERYPTVSDLERAAYVHTAKQRSGCLLSQQVSCVSVSVTQGIIDHNIRENRQAWEGSGGCAEAAELSWGTTNVSAMGAPWSAPDFVIAADVIYDRALFQPLLSTLCAYGASIVHRASDFKSTAQCSFVTAAKPASYVTGAGTDILLAHVRRWTSDRRFFRMLRSARFTVEDATGSLEKGGDSHASHTTVTGADGGDRRGGSLHERGACRIFRIHRTTGHSQRQQARVNGAARHKGYP